MSIGSWIILLTDIKKNTGRNLIFSLCLWAMDDKQENLNRSKCSNKAHTQAVRKHTFYLELVKAIKNSSMAWNYRQQSLKQDSNSAWRCFQNERAAFNTLECGVQWSNTVNDNNWHQSNTKAREWSVHSTEISARLKNYRTYENYRTSEPEGKIFRRSSPKRKHLVKVCSVLLMFCHAVLIS